MQRLWIGTLVILDIFAARASTSEGKIQVELAQLKYRQTRLAGFGTAMSRPWRWYRYERSGGKEAGDGQTSLLKIGSHF